MKLGMEFGHDGSVANSVGSIHIGSGITIGQALLAEELLMPRNTGATASERADFAFCAQSRADQVRCESWPLLSTKVERSQSLPCERERIYCCDRSSAGSAL